MINQAPIAQSIQLAVASTVLTTDGTGVVITYAAPTVTLTQAQLYQQLSQAQNQLAQLTTQIANVNANIANLQSQLALFPVVATPPTPAS